MKQAGFAGHFDEEVKVKQILAVATCFVLCSWTGMVSAQCTSAALNQQQIRSRVGGNTICAKPGADYPGGATSSDRWQEEHHGSNNGDLWDFKLGNGHPIDPRKKVGTWDTVGGQPAKIVHAYTGGPSYQWTVHDNGGVISFCTGQNGQEHARAKIKAGTNVGCAPSDFP